MKDILDMRSNKVWNEVTVERAGLPVVVRSNDERQDNVFEFADSDKKRDFLGASLAAAEAVQADTDERRGLAVTKSNF